MGTASDGRPLGLRCPRCGCTDLRVTATRPRLNGTVLRYRRCRHCGRRLVTVEAPPGRR